MTSRRDLRARCSANVTPPSPNVCVTPSCTPSCTTGPPAVACIPTAPVCTNGTHNCLYAPYDCVRYRASAPHIWCSHCRVYAMSIWSQNGIHSPPGMIFDPPNLCTTPCVPTFYPAGMAPLRLEMGATCVQPTYRPTTCPSATVSCPMTMNF